MHQLVNTSLENIWMLIINPLESQTETKVYSPISPHLIFYLLILTILKSQDGRIIT